MLIDAKQTRHQKCGASTRDKFSGIHLQSMYAWSIYHAKILICFHCCYFFDTEWIRVNLSHFKGINRKIISFTCRLLINNQFRIVRWKSSNSLKRYFIDIYIPLLFDLQKEERTYCSQYLGHLWSSNIYRNSKRQQYLKKKRKKGIVLIHQEHVM